MNPNLVLPVGTRIVTRVEVKTDAARALRPVGAVAEIIAAPADALHSYRVRFPDGAEAPIRRREFSIWSQYREDAVGGSDPLIDHELLARYVIYRCVVGSGAYGLDGPGSDTDRRGIYLPPVDLQWSLYGVPEQLENPDSQECYWELQKFPRLGAQGEPERDRVSPSTTAAREMRCGRYFLQSSSPMGWKPLPMSTSNLWTTSLSLF